LVPRTAPIGLLIIASTIRRTTIAFLYAAHSASLLFVVETLHDSRPDISQIAELQAIAGRRLCAEATITGTYADIYGASSVSHLRHELTSDCVALVPVVPIAIRPDDVELQEASTHSKRGVRRPGGLVPYLRGPSYGRIAVMFSPLPDFVIQISETKKLGLATYSRTNEFRR
jgi:hypothetical protein